MNGRPSSRRWLSIQDLAARHPRAIAIGPFGSALKADLYSKSGVPVVRGQDITAMRELDQSGLVYVPQAVADSFPACVVKEGDLIFPHRGAIGRVGIIRSREYLLSSSMMKLTCDTSLVRPDYLFYYFRGPGRIELLSRASTVGTPGIGQPLASLRGIRVSLPSLAEQRAVAQVLGALDDKIAANQQLACTAGALAEALFQRSLRTETYPRPLVDVLTLEYGKSLPAPMRLSGAAAVYGSSGVVGTHNVALRSTPGAVVGRKGTVGAVYWASGPHFPIDTTFYAVPKGDMATDIFCYFALRHLRLDKLTADSAVPGLNRGEAYSQMIRLPSSEAIDEFSKQANQLMAVSTQADFESGGLAAMRDKLLPHLMSGRLRVRDAEKLVSERV